GPPPRSAAACSEPPRRAVPARVVRSRPGFEVVAEPSPPVRLPDGSPSPAPVMLQLVTPLASPRRLRPGTTRSLLHADRRPPRPGRRSAVERPRVTCHCKDGGPMLGG